MSVSTSLADAYAACERLARAHYENFPVASRLLPPRMRPHVAAVYAFARTADDFADEETRTPEERHRLLDAWLARLRACVTEDGLRLPPVELPDARAQGDPGSWIFRALGHTIRACSLPLSLFEDLVSAFRQDIDTRQYASWDQVLDYCRRSANPIGRLVLRIAGYQDERLERSSDALCTALQLANFWQDFERDWRRGRLYLPASDRDGCGARETDLDARRLTPEWRCALARAVARTRDLFQAGRPVCDGVSGRLGLELRLTWLGGWTIVDRLEAAGYDVFAQRPTLRTVDVVALLWKAVRWRTRS